MPRHAHTLHPLPRALRPFNPGREGRKDEAMWGSLDRVQVLGEGGHNGCVNALSWSDDGRTLLSGSDDTRICIWQPDPSPPASSFSPHPLVLSESIQTGHRANIFSAKFLPHANTPTIVTCAGDREVRVMEVERLARGMGGELDGHAGDGVTVLRCHRDRTKRIATENSPSLFLTVSEDGTVRQHDLRRPHTCRSECPDPLFYAPRGVDLYSLSVSTVTPHIFAVAGRTDCAFICDRRMTPRQTPSWGPHVRSSGQVHCVRRLGLASEEWDKVSPRTGDRVFGEERHVTCVKMSPERADEVAVAFARHSTSLFSIYDSPPPTDMRATSNSPTIVSPNQGRRSTTPKAPSPTSSPVIPALGVPPKPDHRPQADSDDEMDGSSSPSLGKRRISDRSSIASNDEPLTRQRTDSAHEEIPAETSAAESDPVPGQIWPFVEPDDGLLATPTHQTILEDGDDVDAADVMGSLASAESTRVAAQTGQTRISPATPPIRYTADDFLRDDNEDEDGEERSEHMIAEDATLSDLEEMAMDMMDQEDDFDADDFDELDEDEDVEIDADDFDASDDAVRELGGSNASRLEREAFDRVDMILPRRSFRGARNVETVKDCNFLGTRADKVCSGSDDGNFFVWDKETGRLEGIWEGDGSVVNVMEQHPTLPLVAVSGIDNTVKMFAPTSTRPIPSFSRTHMSDTIVERNTRAPRFLSGGAFERATLLQFLMSRGLVARVDDDDGGEGDDGGGDGEVVEGCQTQ